MNPRCPSCVRSNFEWRIDFTRCSQCVGEETSSIASDEVPNDITKMLADDEKKKIQEEIYHRLCFGCQNSEATVCNMDLINHTPCNRCIYEDRACMYWINLPSPTTNKTLSDDTKKMKKDMLAYDTRGRDCGRWAVVRGRRRKSGGLVEYDVTTTAVDKTTKCRYFQKNWRQTERLVAAMTTT